MSKSAFEADKKSHVPKSALHTSKSQWKFGHGHVFPDSQTLTVCFFSPTFGLVYFYGTCIGIEIHQSSRFFEYLGFRIRRVVFLSARNLVLSFSSYAMSAAILSKEVQVWDLGGGKSASETMS